MNNNVVIRKVRLNTIQDVRDFCYAVSDFPRNTSIKAKHGSIVSDAKSILDMMALNLREPIEIVFESSDIIDNTKIDNAIYKWEV